MIETIKTTMQPRVVAEEADFLVVLKPSHWHTAPLPNRDDPTLLEWCAARFPETRQPVGRKAEEGGIVHRLDYGTTGLVLVARTQRFMDAILTEQEAGRFVKEYQAICRPTTTALPGFPPRPSLPTLPGWIESGFRAYGPGRRAVRPVAAVADDCSAARRQVVAWDRGQPYRTDVLWRAESDAGMLRFGVRLRRGFRHQVRCHLAWLGFPIIGDQKYGGVCDVSETQIEADDKNIYDIDISLIATVLEFTDVLSGRSRRFILDDGTNSGR